MDGTHMSKSMRFDTILLMVTLLLVGVGMVMVYSASSVVGETRFESSSFFLKRHLFRAMISMAIMLLVLRVDYHVFGTLSRWMLVGSIFLLIHLAVQKVRFGGVWRWEYLGPISFQPSDVARLALVLYMADWLAHEGDKIRDFWQGLLRHLALMACILGLIVVEPDLGTAVLIGMILLVLLFVGRMRLSHMLFVGVASSPILYLLISRVPFRLARFREFLHLSSEPEGVGYQVNQSLLSLGTGGVFGVGLGAGRQKYLYLPEPHTDFVFSVIGEELGFVGAFLILILFLVFAWRGVQIARKATDVEGFFMAVGLTLMIVLYAFFNVAVAVDLVPTTGLPLPFISYGGSSLLLSLVGTGILLNISSYVGSESGAVRDARSTRKGRNKRRDVQFSDSSNLFMEKHARRRPRRR